MTQTEPLTDVPLAPVATPAQDGPRTARLASDGPIVTPAAVLDWRERLGLASTEPVPSRVLLVLDPVALEGIRRRRDLRQRRGPAGRLMVYRPGGADRAAIGVLAVAGVGGPAAAVAIEELVALGGCELISIGLAGGLGGGCLSGDVVVLDGALPRDGVSAAYGATDQPVVPDPALRDEVMACLEGARVGAETGRSWTTDSVYRETRAGVDEAIAAGAVAVEMEAAAVLAVSRALGARSAAIVVIADRIVDGRWLPPDDLARCRRAEAAVIDALLDR